MEHNKTKIKNILPLPAKISIIAGMLTFIIITSIMVIVLIVSLKFYNASSLRYSEEDFIGKTVEEVKEMYGEFDICRDYDVDGIIDEVAYYVIDGPEFGNDNDFCYYIFFDNNEIAIRGEVKMAYYQGG